jgi:hypothetical protein
VKKLLTIVFVVIVSAATALAQSTYGTLLGSVTDQSGARVQNASVTATEVNTRIVTTATTNSLGDFEIPNLHPGLYRVAVKVQGFKALTHEGVILEARAEVRVDSVLQVGTAQASVEVQAAAPVITTETAAVSDAIGGKDLNSLPTTFRATSPSPIYLMTNLPGVVVDSGFGGSDMSISGSNPVQQEYTVDGFSVVSSRSNGVEMQMFPSTDMVSEMSVNNEAANAEFGQVANLTFTTKSGTDQFHGALFEYIQNTDLNARNYFATTRPTVHANDFGGAVGGPVILPHYNGRHRTFFYFDYEGNRQPLQEVSITSVPTQAMIGGDFSSLCSAYSTSGTCTASGGIQLTNPFTGVAIPNNKLTSSLINSVSTKMLTMFYPLPNVTQSSAGNIVNNHNQNIPQVDNTNLFDLRIDEKFNDKQSVYVRYSYKKISELQAQSLLQGQEAEIPKPITLGISYVYTIRPTLLNELRFGLATESNVTSFPSFSNGAQVISSLGLQNMPASPAGSGYPSINFSGSSGASSTGGGREEPEHERRFQGSDNLTWMHGHHTIKTGFDIRREQFHDYVSSTYPDQYGNFYFSGQYSGYDVADFLMGLPYEVKTFNTPTDTDQLAHTYSFFGQDDYQINHNLTVTFGLRYEYHQPFYDRLNNVSNFDTTNGNVVVQNSQSLKLTGLSFEQGADICGWGTYDPPTYLPTAPCTNIVDAAQDKIPTQMRWASKLMFVPRAGFAYRLTNKTVVRSGAGIYDAALLGRLAYSGTGNNTSDFRQWNNSFTSGVPLFQFPGTRPTVNPACAGCPAGNLNFGTAMGIHTRDPYAMQWNLTVERDLGWKTGLRVTYTGMHTIGLINTWDQNEIAPQSTAYSAAERPFPNFQVLQMRSNISSQMFNSMENVLTHRFSGGMMFQTSLVWNKSLTDNDGDDNNTSGFAGETGYSVINHLNIRADRGNSSYQRRLRWLTTNTWVVPVGRGQRFGANMNRALDAVIGGWHNSNILVLQSGPYMTPYVSVSASKDPSGTNAPNRVGALRPDRLPLSSCSSYTTSQARAFGNSCYYFGWSGPIGRYGNSGVGILEGPGTINWDSGLGKEFNFFEKTKLRFEANGTDVLNHPNFTEPKMKASSSSFGTSTSTQGGEAVGERTIQGSLRLEF